MHTTRRAIPRAGGLIGTAVLMLALVGTPARAATQTRSDPSDAPGGAFGKADLRTVDWDVTASSATLTVAVDASTYGAGDRALIGLHVLVDTDGDGLADDEVAATRNADGLRVDLSLRALDRTLSTADCQDLAGHSIAAPTTVATTISGGLETFSYSFDPALVVGGLAAFRWAAFGQAPPGGSGPWDTMPDAVNPDPAAANPGDRRCNGALSGLRVRMTEGVAFPDPIPAPPSAPPSAPAAGQFTIGKPKLDTSKGVAKLIVDVPGEGELTLSGKSVKTRILHAASAGPVTVVIKAKGDARKDLAKHGTTRVRFSITFAPAGGEATTQTKKLKLKLKN